MNEKKMKKILTVLLFNASASQRLGSQRRTMQTSADADMMSEALEESGSVCWTSAAMAEASAASASIAINVPMEYVPIFSTLKVRNVMRQLLSRGKTEDEARGGTGPRPSCRPCCLLAASRRTHRRSAAFLSVLLSSPGFATLRKRQRTMRAEATSIADWMPKKTSAREEASAGRRLHKARRGPP